MRARGVVQAARAIGLLGILGACALLYLGRSGWSEEPLDVAFAPPTAAMKAAEPDPPIFGATVHFGMVQLRGYLSGDVARKQLDLIGADAYRDGIVWASFDVPSEGGPAVLKERRRIIDFLSVAGRSPLLVLAAPRQKPATSGPPFTDQQLDQFARYAKATVALSRPYKPMFEIWNEFNLMVGNEKPAKRLSGEGDPSDPRAAVHYARLAKIGTQAIKSVDPEATVLVGAVGDDPGWAWTKAIVRDGALEGADGLSVHLYNHCARPENRTGHEMIDRLVELQDMLRKENRGKDIPLQVSEFGWPTSQGKCGLPLDRAGANFAQFILEAAEYPWLRGLWQYELKDSGLDKEDIEDNFGFFTFDDRPKPAVCFAREAMDIVRKARRIEVERPSPDVFVMRAVMDDHQVIGLWTSQPDKTFRAQIPAPDGPVRRMCGEAQTPDTAAEVSIVPLLARYPMDAKIDVRILQSSGGAN